MSEKERSERLSKITLNRAQELRGDSARLGSPDALDAANRLERLGLRWSDKGTKN